MPEHESSPASASASASPAETRGLAGADLYRAEALMAYNKPEAPRAEPSLRALLGGLWLTVGLLVALSVGLGMVLAQGRGRLWP